MLKVFTAIIFLQLSSANDQINLPKNTLDITDTGFKEVKKINDNSHLRKDCDPLTTAPLRSCSEITDSFCSKLWNEKNKGNIKVFDGEIKAGKSDKSDLSLLVLEDYNALINSLPHLPKDSKKMFRPLFSEFKKILSQERDDSKWYREVAIIKFKISNAIDDLADARLEKRYPKIKIKNSKDWTIDQTLLYKKEKRDLNDELIIAKYKKHPNWLRVEKIFPQLKSNLVKEIDELKIPDERKRLMKTKLLSINLSLPLENPDAVSASQECSTTETNAFYTSTTKKFTVCAGLFNSYQSESGLAYVVKHELGHAIDSESLAEDDWSTHSPIAIALKKLIHAKGPVYKCDEWENINKNVLKSSEVFALQNIDPLEKLYSCFRGGGKLEEMSKENMPNITKVLAKQRISNYAENQSFMTLAQKWVKDKDKLKESETYLRPDKYLQKAKGYDDTNEIRDVSLSEIFTQNFLCLLSQSNLTEAQFESSSKEIRSNIFESAIEQTSRILQIQSEDYFKYCGKNCSDLTSFQLSVNPREKNADWFATLAFPSFLENLASDKRAEASALATSLFCNSTDIAITAPELALSEKKYSLESHPDNRARRVSLYTPEVAKLINCKIEDTEETALCNP